MSTVVERHWADSPVAGYRPAAVIALRRVDATEDHPRSWHVTLDSAFVLDCIFEVKGEYTERNKAEAAMFVLSDHDRYTLPVVQLPPLATWGDKRADTVINETVQHNHQAGQAPA